MTKRLYMYDVRGIQDYIFRTNKLKEIVGASLMVEDKILSLFTQISKEEGVKVRIPEKKDYRLEFSFDDNNPLDAEILYYGGGNLLVLFDNDEIAQRINTRMRIQLVKDTYSLQLAIAGVDVTGSDGYQKDYQALRKEMDAVKLNMLPLNPVGSFPFTLNDPQTGSPLSCLYDHKKVTYETKTKLEKFEELKDRHVENINDFASEIGDSMIAIVHIDGNGMGKLVKETMSQIQTYEEATKCMRAFSEKVDDVFTDTALKSVRSKLKLFGEKAGLGQRHQKTLFRTIIHSGDDITFVCNARIALQCAMEFMRCIEEEGTFTVCGGVYVMHSHFPFSRGYELCEQLCANAKKKSHEKEEGGNYIDFHISYNSVLNDMDSMREMHYVSKDGKKLYGRPYHVGKDPVDNAPQITNLCSMIKKLEKDSIARGKMKALREQFYEGNAFVDKELERINSRLTEEDRFDTSENKDYSILFDAIEVLDLKWGETNE